MSYDILISSVNKIVNFFYWFVFKQKNFSQGNEEEIIAKIFKTLSDGFYVDVGCHHPKRFSNTAMLYKMGWSGINIDGDSKNLKQFSRYRRRDINLNYVISNKTNPVVFYYFKDSALNGILSKNRLELLKKNGFKPLKKKKISPVSLNKILDLYLPKNKKIDLLTIDVEGHDFEVLQSIDLKKYFVKVILTEVNENKSELNQYLEGNGYHLFKKEDRNLFYVKVKS